MGFRTAVILDPGISTGEDYEVGKEGLEKEVFVQYPDGTPYTADVWPGECYFPDFTNPETRQWWGDRLKTVVDDGVEGFWNDMNEPASWGQTTPNLLQFNFDGRETTHREARNVYGLQMCRSTYEASKKHLDRRPFVLTRAAFSGVQRYSAVWTGDNVASDEHFLLGVRLLNSLGLTGVAFSGYDIGGFAGEASPELFARWMAVGAFTPFMRCHSMVNSRAAEPWSFGEEVTEIVRNYVKLRYRLLPYLYSAFYEATQNGMPIVRSLAIDYTHDPNSYNGQFQHQYLFGPSLLVAPTASGQQISKVYLPKGNWYDLYNDTFYEGEQTILVELPKERLPLFVKAGYLLVMQSAMNSVTESPEPTLTVHLYLKPNPTTDEPSVCFDYYEDDGDTYRHEEGDYYLRTFTYRAAQQQLTISPVSGTGKTKFRKVKLYLHGGEFLLDTVKVNGKKQTVATEMYRFVEPLTSFEPLAVAQAAEGIAALPFVEFRWSGEEVVVRW